MELLKVKERLRLARKGHRLLKDKRDTLLSEFMKVAVNASEIAQEAVEQGRKARQSLQNANIGSDPISLESASYTGDGGLDVDFERRNIMGVELFNFTLGERLRQIDERGYGLSTTHPLVDDVGREHDLALSSYIQLAEVQQSLLGLSAEVLKTKRRVNALEHRLIPSLEGNKKKISQRLEELERESFFRRKLMKRKLGR
jgi:V/A-type H+-transporting ATPase subunit D